MSAIQQLLGAYRNRSSEARFAHARGEAVIGYIDATTPVELILAAGGFPMLAAAELPHPTPTADALIERSEPWPMRSVAERALNSDYEFLRLLVIARSQEWLYYNLKEAVRIGEAAHVPPLLLCDLIQNLGPRIAAYNQAQMQLLCAELERATGVKITDKRLSHAIACTNRCRSLRRLLVQRRDAGQVSGLLALQLLGAGYFLHPEHYAELLTQALQELTQTEPAASNGPRLLIITAEALFHVELHRALEQAGGRIIAEDSWWGTRSANRDIPVTGDLFAQVRDCYLGDTQGEDVQPREAREGWVRARIESGGLDAVVFYLPPGDKRFGWGYPRLAARIRELGLGVHLIRRDILASAERIRTDAAAFIEALRTGASTTGTGAA